MKIYEKSDKGLARAQNQDFCGSKVVEGKYAAALVCDGMGGMRGGDLASEIAAKAILAEFVDDLKIPHTDAEIKKIMVELVSRANSLIYSFSLEDPSLSGMGTTIVMALCVGQKVHIIHAGDSRAYLLSPSKISRLTKDHSFVQEMVDIGELTAAEAEAHPKKNIITRALGVSKFIEFDYANCKLTPDSAVLLCTDGLTNMAKDKEIFEVYEKYKPSELCARLIDLANGHGGSDNITAVLVTL